MVARSGRLIKLAAAAEAEDAGQAMGGNCEILPAGTKRKVHGPGMEWKQSFQATVNAVTARMGLILPAGRESYTFRKLAARAVRTWGERCNSRLYHTI